jgi:hypothetical protein
MNNTTENTFGTPFERIFVTFLSIATGLTLIFLAIQGPLFLHHIKYKTAEVINNQLLGQDIVNMFILSPILIFGGITLFLRKQISKYLLITTPLYLIYFVLSYTIGWEWSSTKYAGNSESYTFYFLFILISSLVILLYSLSIFPNKVESTFKKKGLALYSILFSIFILIFASMWIKEVLEVASTGTARAYDIAFGIHNTFRSYKCLFALGKTKYDLPYSIHVLWLLSDNDYCRECDGTCDASK